MPGNEIKIDFNSIPDFVAEEIAFATLEAVRASLSKPVEGKEVTIDGKDTCCCQGAE